MANQIERRLPLDRLVAGKTLAEKEFRFLSVDRERWQRPLDQCLRRWMEFPGNRDRGRGLWRKESRRHGRERRSVPGPSRLVAIRSGSLSRWLVSQGSKETDLCGRKNKHQPCRLPSAARLPWLQRLRLAGPNPTQARMRATSRRTGKPRNSCRARTLPRPRAGAGGRSIWSRSSLFERSIWALVAWVCGLLSP